MHNYTEQGHSDK